VTGYRIEITGLEKAIAAFSKSPIPIIMTFFDSRVMPVILAITQRETPKKTGTLAEGQHIVRMGDLHWAIMEREDYGAWLRLGVDYTGPMYPLRPAQALYWEELEHPVAWSDWKGFTQNDYGERAAREGVTAVASMLSALLADLKKGYSF